MVTEAEHPARGRVIAVHDDKIVFAPTNSSYEIHLKTRERYDGPVNEPVEGIIRVSARKVWTVVGGGNFLIPITGPLRLMQGRVIQVSDAELIVHISTPMVVKLPTADSAFELARGPIVPGARVNIMCFPDGAFELLKQPVAK